MLPVNAVPLESLFERWRSAGDLDALAEVFDACAPELLRVARHLAPEASLAEDLLQTTFLEVLRQPQRFDARRPLLPWLVGILGHHAHKQRRASRRQLDPTRLRAERPVDPADEASGHEFETALGEAIGNLAEPYASVVRAHLRDRERPKEIAARLGRASGTVRMQLSRGLAMLRAALPAGLAVPLCVARAEALDRVRTELLAAAAQQGALGGGMLATVATVARSPLVWVGLAICALGIALPLARRAPSAGSVPGSPLRAEVPASGAAGPAVAGSPLERTEAGERAPLDAPVGVRPGYWLVGTVALPVGLDGATAIRVRSQGLGADRAGTVAADGRYELEITGLFEPAPGDAEQRARFEFLLTHDLARPSGAQQLSVVADHPRCLVAEATPVLDLGSQPRPADARIELRVDFALETAAVITGRVELEGGADLGLVELGVLRASRLRDPVFEPELRASVDATGRFSIRHALEEELELWVVHPRLAPETHRLVGRRGAIEDCGTFRLRAGTASIEGRVVGADGETGGTSIGASLVPPSGLPVGVTTFGGVLRVGGRLVQGFQSGDADALGRFRFAGLAPGSWRIQLISFRGLPVWPGDAGLDVDTAAGSAVLGADRSVIRIEVRGPDGPLADARLLLGCGDHRGAFSTAADGSFAFSALRAAEYELVVERDGFATQSLRLPIAGRRDPELVVVDLLRAPTGTLVLRVGGAPAADANVLVRIECLDEARAALERRGVIEAGALELRDLPPGRLRVRVAPAHASGMPFAIFGQPTATLEVEVELGAAERREVVLERPAVGRIRVVSDWRGHPDMAVAKFGVVDALGRSVATSTVIERSGGWLEAAGILPLAGSSYLAPDLPPGRYSLVVEHPAIGRQSYAVEVVAGEVMTLRVP